jgi:NAD(P)-dependent dehydrogenase (short-subunit alcohol dehydrogenase family)
MSAPPPRPSGVDPEALLTAPPDEVAARIRAAAELLDAVTLDRGLLAQVDTETREYLLVSAGLASRPDKQARKQLSRALEKYERLHVRASREALLDQTGIRRLRENPIFETPRRLAIHAGLDPDAQEPEPQPLLGARPEARTCYVCRKDYRDVHWFYDQLCPLCGDLNHARRDPRHDLSGRYAVVTGARVKIGYQAAIMLLRNGCHVVVSTRFPRDAAGRYAAEPDFADWGHRLEIHGLDLRHVPSVELFCERLLARLPRLDYIINNACQTVRRPPAFYDHLMARERALASDDDRVTRRLLAEPEAAFEDVSGSASLALTAERFTGSRASELSQVALLPEDHARGDHLFPAGRLDADAQQVDLREMNSWRLKLAEVATVELLEVHVVNAVAPFILNARLKPLMERVPSRDAHIVNVSAMEGQFYRTYKSDRHPHTNMAKASLNMMTRTSAADYIQSGIHMNSVDTGWVTDEDPAAIAARKRDEHAFSPPLDIVDGAARIVDPIFDGLATGRHIWGQFLKDYRITDW